MNGIINYTDMIAHYTNKEAYDKITRSRSLLTSIFSDSGDVSETCLDKVMASITHTDILGDSKIIDIISCSHYISFYKNNKYYKLDCNLSKPMVQNFSKRDGCCLLFNKKELIEEIERQYGKNYEIICKNIKYRKGVLPRYTTNELNAMKQRNDREVAIELMLEKDKQFSYEQEIRILMVPNSIFFTVKPTKVPIELKNMSIVSCKYRHSVTLNGGHVANIIPDNEDSIASPYEFINEYGIYAIKYDGKGYNTIERCIEYIHTKEKTNANNISSGMSAARILAYGLQRSLQIFVPKEFSHRKTLFRKYMGPLPSIFRDVVITFYKKCTRGGYCTRK